MDFCQLFARTPEEFNDLRRRVDLSARLGHSYELGLCRLPTGCRPARAAPGFWAQDGAYFFYVRPAVDYEGSDSRLSSFFSQAIRRFERFSDLERLLLSLSEAGSSPPPQPEESPGFLPLRRALEERVVGQSAAVEAAAFKLYGHIGKRAPLRPLSLIFYGPTCVGKSELCKSVAPVLNRCLGTERYRMVWTELNTFAEAHSVYRLIGAPPGYAGYDDPPVLESVREQPYTVFVFDELDKAHPEILKVFMSILDEGRCCARRQDEQGGWELDFCRCIFLFTTNADLSAPPLRLGFAPPGKGTPAPAAPQSPGPAGLAQRLFQADEAARCALVRAGVLREIAGRFSGLIGFQPLSSDARESVTARQIAALGREYGLDIVEVAPAIARALTPADALSLRSTAGVLEGTLTPLFLSHAQAEGGKEPLRLTGSVDKPCLLPAWEQALFPIS